MFESHVRVEVTAGIGWIQLDRPSRLNAITPAMFRRVASTLRRWALDDDVRAVVLSGTPGGAFSAGGDVTFLHRIDLALAQDYWSEQFALDILIASLRKPVIALIDGIAMGSGWAMAMHSDRRIVTERARLAMPEAAIGLVPDAGATRIFGRAPGATGQFLAMSGITIGAADAIGVGAADVFVPSERLAELVGHLREGADPDSALADATADAGPSELQSARVWLDPAFAEQAPSDILASLEASPHPEPRAAADALRAVSPTAAVTALRLVRDGPAADDTRPLEDVLLAELRANSGLFELADRPEGIRARIIDKDREPRWSPRSFEEVDDEGIDAIIATEVPDEYIARIR